MATAAILNVTGNSIVLDVVYLPTKFGSNISNRFWDMPVFIFSI